MVCSEVLPFSRSVRSSPQLGATPDLFDQETQRWSLERQARDCAEVTRALRVLPLRSLHSAHLAWRQSHPDHSIARALRHRTGIIQLRAVRISTRRSKLLEMSF